MADEEDGEMVDLEDTAGATTAPAPTADPAAPKKPKGGKKKARKRARRRRLLITIAASTGVALAALIALVIVLALRLGHEHHLDSLRKSATKAADSYALDFSTWDYRHLDENFATVSSHLDPSFRAKYEQVTSTLKAVVVQKQGVATATIVESAVQSISSSHAVVIVFLNQQVTNTDVKNRLDTDRLEITLVRSHGNWLMSNLLLK